MTTRDTSDTRSAESDIAFLKALVEEGSRTRMSGGAAFLAGGLLYGFQCLVQWAQAVGLIHLPGGVMVGFLAAITVSFLAILGVVVWRDRGIGQRAVGMRALNAAFAGAGIANLVLCSVFAVVAIRERSQTIWLLYPVTLSVVFGAAWYVAFMLRRRAWLGLVSLGWYATAVALGLLVSSGDVATYVLAIAVALLVLMALPGAVMMRSAEKPD